jgi:Bax protein
VFDTTDEVTFVKSIERCVNYLNFKIPPNERISYILIAAQSSLESNFGTSRFAIEANNILGIRTYSKDDKQIKSKSNPNAEWGLKVFTTKCACVDYYIKLLNNHNAYKKFRESRIKQNSSGVIHPKKLAETLTSYASDQNYIPKVKKQIDYLIGILDKNAG